MIVSGTAARFVDRQLPDHDDIQREMTKRADELGFPIIGRDAGAFLATMAAARRARSVFEFGSGFGYSATWFFRGMPDDGEVVLTEVDADELALAEEYLDRAGVGDRAHLEHGDALTVVERYDGPFDVVLIDCRKQDYPEALGRVAEKVPPGGVVIADNVMAGPVSHEDLLEAMDTDDAPGEEVVAALVRYLETVRDDPAWHTCVLPVGNGLSVSVKVIT